MYERVEKLIDNLQDLEILQKYDQESPVFKWINGENVSKLKNELCEILSRIAYLENDTPFIIEFYDELVDQDNYNEFGFREGVGWKFIFKNGYGASIINNGFGKEAGLFELAVLKKNLEDNKYHLCYDTEITNDVILNLTNKDVKDYLYKIKNLKVWC